MKEGGGGRFRPVKTPSLEIIPHWMTSISDSCEADHSYHLLRHRSLGLDKADHNCNTLLAWQNSAQYAYQGLTASRTASALGQVRNRLSGSKSRIADSLVTNDCG